MFIEVLQDLLLRYTFLVEHPVKMLSYHGGHFTAEVVGDRIR
jgi:hypothetical protein